MQSGPQTNRLEVPSHDGLNETPARSINIAPKIENVQINKVSQNTLYGSINSKLTQKEFAA